ncbi:MAG TPA: TIGR00730 family Rossman fold protein [Xanthomonadales bacterium]|nr:TIGR00730 family Rossman fold protein [Xanthomonadales bacterium]
MKRVCVYCGSNPGRQPIYREAAAELGRELVRRDIALVYGGASIGVMGAVANAVLENGGEVIGVIPQSLAIREVAHNNLTELIVVTSMHERKAQMAELADGFVALPGGWGTFEEIFEILTWAQLGIHSKPCGLLNIANYFDHLALFLQHAMDERFVREEYKPMIIMEQQPETLLDRFSQYQPPQVRKWIGPDES